MVLWQSSGISLCMLCIGLFFLFFFFSSRRRHTRSLRDWSSDVCSSDLTKANMRTPYWDWTFREGEVHYHKYCGTPPEQLLFAMRAAFDLIFAEGLENVFARHRLLAEATRRAVGVWAEGQALGFNVAEAQERCDTVTAVVTPTGETM